MNLSVRATLEELVWTLFLLCANGEHCDGGCGLKKYFSSHLDFSTLCRDDCAEDRS